MGITSPDDLPTESSVSIQQRQEDSPFQSPSVGRDVGV